MIIFVFHIAKAIVKKENLLHASFDVTSRRNETARHTL